MWMTSLYYFANLSYQNIVYNYISLAALVMHNQTLVTIYDRLCQMAVQILKTIRWLQGGLSRVIVWQYQNLTLDLLLMYFRMNIDCLKMSFITLTMRLERTDGQCTF